MPVAVLFIALIFIVPIGGIIAFVVLRANNRKAERAGPWGALAQNHGGYFDGDRVTLTRPDHRIVLEVKLVSVMQAASGPYYPDGGTFTQATMQVDPQQLQVATVGPARVDPAQLVQLVPGVNAMPAHARVILAPHEATVVLDGSVIDLQALEQTFRGLEAIRQAAAQHGALPVAA